MNRAKVDDLLIPWMLFAAELLGTALLVAVGLSIVILFFGHGSPVVQFIPSAGWRRLVTDFLFGTTEALIAISPLGKESGVHDKETLAVVAERHYPSRHYPSLSEIIKLFVAGHRLKPEQPASALPVVERHGNFPVCEVLAPS